MLNIYQGILAMLIGVIISSISKVGFGETILYVFLIMLLFAGILVLHSNKEEK